MFRLQNESLYLIRIYATAVHYSPIHFGINLMASSKLTIVPAIFSLFNFFSKVKSVCSADFTSLYDIDVWSGYLNQPTNLFSQIFFSSVTLFLFTLISIFPFLFSILLLLSISILSLFYYHLC